MKKVIVTGANGFIGSKFVEYLLSKGMEVYAVVRNENSFRVNAECAKNTKVKIIKGSYDTYCLLDSQIRDKDIDLFFHMAWEFQGKSLYDYDIQLNNVRGACEAIELASKVGCRRFVFINSFFAYKKDFYLDNNGVRYSDYCSIYGKCKKTAAELTKILAQKASVEFVSIMLSNIFGKGDNSERAVNTMLMNMLNSEPVPVVEGKMLYDYIYIDDAVRGMLVIAENGRNGEEYYLGNNALRPFKDFVYDMSKAIAPDAQLLFGAFNDTSYIDFSDIDLYKAYRDTGFIPKCNIYQSFKETAEWLKKRYKETNYEKSSIN